MERDEDEGLYRWELPHGVTAEAQHLPAFELVALAFWRDGELLAVVEEPAGEA